VPGRYQRGGTAFELKSVHYLRFYDKGGAKYGQRRRGREGKRGADEEKYKL